jgi:hypothetical protein
MNRLPVAMILALALAGCAGAPPARQPVAADPAPCTGDRFYHGVKSYARCIRHVASPPRPTRQIRGAMREHRALITGDVSAEDEAAG